MKLFITSVAGQLGHDVVNSAVARGHVAVGSDIQPARAGIQDGSAAAYVQLDITDREAVLKIIGRGTRLCWMRSCLPGRGRWAFR